MDRLSKPPRGVATLAFAIRDENILLAIKKRRFGKDKWNGYGGKPEESDESLEATCIRETREEVGITVEREDLEYRGSIDFYFLESPEFDQRVHIWTFTQWTGEPHETQEMMPQWFTFADIPYEAMWVDDKYWLPEMLKGKEIRARFVFGGKGEGSYIHSMKFEKPEGYAPEINPSDQNS